MPNGKLKGIVPYAVVLALAAWLYHDSASFADVGKPGQLGPDFWPKAVLALLMAVCAIEIVRQALAAPEGGAADAAPDPKARHDDEGPRYPWLLAAGIALTVLYVPGMDILGFFIATVLYLAGFMVVGRYRRWRVIGITSVAGSLAFVFVFMKIVYVSLPLGVGPFRQVSTGIMAALGIH